MCQVTSKHCWHWATVHRTSLFSFQDHLRRAKKRRVLQCSFLRCDRGFQRIRWPGSRSWPQWSRACRNRCSCPDQCCYKWLHSCRACGECSSWDLERHSSTCGLATAQHMAGQQQQRQNAFLSSGTLDSFSSSSGFLFPVPGLLSALFISRQLLLCCCFFTTVLILPSFMLVSWCHILALLNFTKQFSAIEDQSIMT